jgi:hypothetical protein
MIRKTASLLVVSLAMAAAAKAPTGSRNVLAMRLEGRPQPISVAYSKIDVSGHNKKEQSSRVGDQSSGWMIGDPVTLSFDLTVSSDDEASILKTQLNKGRRIVQFRASEPTAIDSTHDSVYQYRGSEALVGELKVSGKAPSIRASLRITCDRVDLSTITVAVPAH